MNRIPCRKCPQCGLFNDFTVEECECGKKLNNIAAQFIDADELSPEEYGEIDTSLKVYVQKCSACGALNYTDNPANPVKVCYNCHKTRIAAIAPVECVAESSDEVEPSSAEEVDNNDASSKLNARQAQGSASPIQQYNADDDDDDDDDDSIQWQGILGNIKKTVGSTSQPSTAKTSQQNNQQQVGQNKSQQTNELYDADDDDDDDDEAGDWSGILGSTPKKEVSSAARQQAAPASTKKDITLTAIRYGRLSFTIEAGQDTYMLGRSAKHGNFLCQDGRVGNEHCYLFYRDGVWFVKDNNSRNGTAVNSRDIGLNGECRLSDGDELKLGHHPDSMAFRISIN